MSLRPLFLVLCVLFASTSFQSHAANDAPLILNARSRARAESTGAAVEWIQVEKRVEWNATKTAIIVCDMWDQHWCKGATERVAEMAPRMNEVLKAARKRGVLVIHAPSETMKSYADQPQRKRAQQVPKVDPPRDINQWRSLNIAKEGPLPIDDSDGGCDDQPQCRQHGPWKRQIDSLEIAPDDYISDNGEEVFSILQKHGIENVIVLGVHTNMCVLGRPFSIRQMVSLGKNVVLMRDMTDTMYNSRMRPWVSHFVGTDLVVEHIEKHWCPSVTSADLVGGEAFRFKADRRKTIAFIIGENEYHTWETLPAFARQDLEWRGYKPVFVAASTKPGDPEFKGFEALAGADVFVVSARRRPAPKRMLELMKAHVAAGKPVIGIRTASHAFAPRGADIEKVRSGAFGEWPEFDADVLGGNYTGHHGNGEIARVEIAAAAAGHALLGGVDVNGFESPGSLYKVSPLKSTATPLLMGRIPGQPPEPIAWINTSGPRNAKVFYTSLGHTNDFASPAFRRLLLNAIAWAVGDPLPSDKALSGVAK